MLIEWQPGIKVREDLVRYMDELSEELLYGDWDQTDSIEVKIWPLIWEAGNVDNARCSKGKIAGLADYGINKNSGNPLAVIWIPPVINSNYRLFIATHEVGHIITNGITPEICFKTKNLNPVYRPWYEHLANEWAVDKLEKWGIKITYKIEKNLACDFWWMIDKARETPELMEVIKDHRRVKSWLRITSKLT